MIDYGQKAAEIPVIFHARSIIVNGFSVRRKKYFIRKFHLERFCY